MAKRSALSETLIILIAVPYLFQEIEQAVSSASPASQRVDAESCQLRTLQATLRQADVLHQRATQHLRTSFGVRLYVLGYRGVGRTCNMRMKMSFTAGTRNRVDAMTNI